MLERSQAEDCCPVEIEFVQHVTPPDLLAAFAAFSPDLCESRDWSLSQCLACIHDGTTGQPCSSAQIPVASCAQTSLSQFGVMSGRSCLPDISASTHARTPSDTWLHHNRAPNPHLQLDTSAA